MIKRKNLMRIIRKAGTKVLYSALLLYYAFRRPEIPKWAKTIVIGALGYLLSPIDTIPDLTPLLGYTDDIGILSYALVLIAAYINDEVRNKARTKIKKWLGKNLDYNTLEQVEKTL